MRSTKEIWYERTEVGSIIAVIVIISNQFLGIELTGTDMQGTLEAVGAGIASVFALLFHFLRQNESENRQTQTQGPDSQTQTQTQSTEHK